MKRFTLSALFLMVAAGTAIPAQAQEIDRVFNLQATRLEHLDNQTKDNDSSLFGTTLQQRLSDERNERTKDNDGSLFGTNLQQRLHEERTERTK